MAVSRCSHARHNSLFAPTQPQAARARTRPPRRARPPTPTGEGPATCSQRPSGAFSNFIFLKLSVRRLLRAWCWAGFDRTNASAPIGAPAFACTARHARRPANWGPCSRRAGSELHRHENTEPSRRKCGTDTFRACVKRNCRCQSNARSGNIGGGSGGREKVQGAFGPRSVGEATRHVQRHGPHPLGALLIARFSRDRHRRA